MDRALVAEPSTTRPAVLSGISFDHANHTVSIVLHLNDHRPFTLGRVDSGLYVDIENARLSPELLSSSKKLSAHSLIQVSARQLRKDTARVILHFDTIARLQAAPLKNPSRICLRSICLNSQPTPKTHCLLLRARLTRTRGNNPFLLAWPLGAGWGCLLGGTRSEPRLLPSQGVECKKFPLSQRVAATPPGFVSPIGKSAQLFQMQHHLSGLTSDTCDNLWTTPPLVFSIIGKHLFSHSGFGLPEGWCGDLDALETFPKEF